MLTFWAFGILVAFVSATIDINIHQLQFVADHLVTDECRKLAEMLHRTEYVINTTVTGKREPKKPCIFLLLKWDRTEGSNNTFTHLAMRLRQLGRQDLSDVLSTSVLGEDDMKLKENFLSNPFRKHIPKESVLLETGKRRKSKKSTKKFNDEEEKFSPWEIASIVSGSIVLLILVSYITYKLFRTAIRRLFRNLAPDIVVDWCDLVQVQCNWCCKNVKRKYDHHVIGRKETRRLTAKQKSSLIELNRNLNNYMNGELESVSFIFSDVDSSGESEWA